MDGVENLYHLVIEHLERGANYPGWHKDIYPTREVAKSAIDKDELYILWDNDKMAGSIVLSHRPEKAYSKADWAIDADYKDIIVIHTLVANPDYMRRGIARKLMDFAVDFARENKMKAVRLDVSTTNVPAMALYEKCGFKCAGIADLKFKPREKFWYRLYELVL